MIRSLVTEGHGASWGIPPSLGSEMCSEGEQAVAKEWQCGCVLGRKVFPEKAQMQEGPGL